MIFLIPAAGKGERFQVTHKSIKPLIQIGEKRMIDWVLEKTPDNPVTTYIAIRPEDRENFLKAGFLDSELIDIRNSTGTSDTIYQALTYIQKYVAFNESIMISNCDNYVDVDYELFVGMLQGARELRPQVQSGAMVFEGNEELRYSYVLTGTDEEPFPIFKCAWEKEVVSDYAMAGVFWFASYVNLMQALKSQLSARPCYNNEHYLSGVYQFFPENHEHIAYVVPRKAVNILGTPEELQAFKRRKGVE